MSDEADDTSRVRKVVSEEISGRLPEFVRRGKWINALAGLFWAFIGAVVAVAAVGFRAHMWLVGNFAQASEVRSQGERGEKQETKIERVCERVSALEVALDGNTRAVGEVKTSVDDLRKVFTGWLLSEKRREKEK